MDAELEELHRQLAAVQMQDTVHRLSERSCVDIILKLIEQNRIQLIWTKTGKECVTPQQLKEEIADEIMSHGGRLSLTELPSLLNVDMTFIQEKAQQLVRENGRTMFLLEGVEIITNYYLDGVCEEINQLLEDEGQLSLVELAQRYTLPAAFLQSAIEERMGKLVHGYFQGGVLYTESFVQRHNARVRGILLACTRPVSLQTLCQQHRLMDTLAYAEAKRLIETRQLPGQLKGSELRSTYIPDIYGRTQEETISSFFRQNGYIQYSAVTKLQITDAKGYLSRLYPDGVKLESVLLSATVMATAASHVDEMIANGTWLSVASIVPAPLTAGDISLLINKLLNGLDKEAKQQVTVVADAYLVSQAFINQLVEKLTPAVQALALDHFAKAATGGQLGPSSGPRGSGAGENDDEEDDSAPRRGGKRGGKKTGGGKKGKGIAGSSDEEEEGSEEAETTPKSGKDARKAARQARAKEKAAGSERSMMRGKSSKSKAGKAEATASAPSAPPLPSVATSGGGKKGKGDADRERKHALTVPEVLKVLKLEWTDSDKPLELLNEMATILYRLLLPAYKETERELYSGSASERREKHEAILEALQSLYDHIQIFSSHAAALLPAAAAASSPTAAAEGKKGKQKKGREADTESGGSKKTKGAEKKEAEADSWLSSLVTTLHKHLLKTLGQRAVDLVLRHEAVQNDMILPDDKAAEEAEAKAMEQQRQQEKEQSEEQGSVESKEGKEGKEGKGAKPKATVRLGPLSQKDREIVLRSAPKRTATAIQALMATLSLPTSQEFVQSLEATARACDLWIKPLDKKKERNVAFALRKGLEAQLASATDPSVIFQTTVLLLCSKVLHKTLHAPARAIPELLKLLQSSVDSATFATLTQYQQLLQLRAKKTRAAEEEEEDSDGEEDSGSATSLAEIEASLESQKEVIRGLVAAAKKPAGGAGQEEDDV